MSKKHGPRITSITDSFLTSLTHIPSSGNQQFLVLDPTSEPKITVSRWVSSEKILLNKAWDIIPTFRHSVSVLLYFPIKIKEVRKKSY